MNSILQYIVLGGTEVHVRVVNEVSVSERLICASLYGHAIWLLDVCPRMAMSLFRESSKRDSTVHLLGGCG